MDKRLHDLMERMTEGPWTVGQKLRDEFDRPFWTVGLAEDGDHYEDMICEVYGTEHDGEAHAQLIASLPELVLKIETLEMEADRLRHLCASLNREIQTLRVEKP